MSRRLEFFFDYGSPFSYLADTQLPALLARSGAEASYRPMLLGGVFKATGNRSPALEPVEAKRRYAALELRRTVERFGVPFRTNPRFPVDTLTLMRASVAARRTGCFETFHRTIFPAFWVDGLDLGDSRVLAARLEQAGLDASRLLGLTRDPEVKAELRATTDEAVARGAFGAPTFFVGSEIFFGADRLPAVEEALRAPPEDSRSTAPEEETSP